MSGIQMMLLGGVSEPGTAAFTNFNDGDSSEGGSAGMTYSIVSDGNVTYDKLNAGGATYEQWLTPAIGADQYEVFATLNTGTLTSGTTGSWLNLGTTRSWNVSRDTVGGRFANMTMDVRRVGTSTVLDTWTVSISATVTP